MPAWASAPTRSSATSYSEDVVLPRYLDLVRSLPVASAHRRRRCRATAARPRAYESDPHLSLRRRDGLGDLHRRAHLPSSRRMARGGTRAGRAARRAHERPADDDDADRHHLRRWARELRAGSPRRCCWSTAFRSTLFVVTDAVGSSNVWRGRQDRGIPVQPLLDWEQLGALAARRRPPRCAHLHAPRSHDARRVTPSSARSSLRSSGWRASSALTRRPSPTRTARCSHGGARRRGARTFRFGVHARASLHSLRDEDPGVAAATRQLLLCESPGSLEAWGSRRFRMRLGLLAGARSVRGIAHPESRSMTPEHPYLSIIVPVKNGQTVLPVMLENLSRSELPRESWELIVVDDGSTDDSAAIASEYADLVIRLPGRSRGPGYARNRGVERARGECVVFLDADVVVRPDTLSRIAATMSSRPDVDARVRCVLRRAGGGRRRLAVPQPPAPLHARSGAGRGADLLGRLRLRAARRVRRRRHVRRVALLARADRGRGARLSHVGAWLSHPAAARDPGHAPQAVDLPRDAQGRLHGPRRPVGATARRAARAARSRGAQGEDAQPPREGEEQHLLRLSRVCSLLALSVGRRIICWPRSVPSACWSS